MPNYDENISFKQGSDNNDADAASIVPVADAEVIWSGTTNRPVENLRSRTEVLRRAVQDLLYYADYDRSLLLRSEAFFSIEEPVAGSGQFQLVATSDLYVYPALTPGRFSGGRHLGGRVFFGDNPYLGPSAVDALVFTASSASTGQRGYFDGDSLSSSTVLTTGANRISLQIQFNPSAATGTFTFAVTGTPRTQILVTCGTQSGVPNHAQFIAAFNADVTSQGTFGVANLLRVASTAVTPGSVAVTIGNGAVQGAYDAEAHLVTSAQLAAFFDADVSGVKPNRLRDGEGLAIAFPPGPVQEYVGPGYPRGGRRQAIFDLPTDRAGAIATPPNTTPPTGYSLFNTGREPEKIPGSVPIGKLLQQGGVTEFVFIDGSRIRLGDAPAPIGAAGPLRRLLAAITPGSSGASLVGYDGSGNWNPNSTVAPTALPSGTVDTALDTIVTQLGGYATGVGGARRVGFETIAGTASAGNTPLSLSGTAPSGDIVYSIQAALNLLLNGPGGVGQGYGVNYRVSERGHRMRGPAPLEKRFNDPLTAVGGGQFITAFLNAPPNLFAGGQTSELSHACLAPVVFDDGAGAAIVENQPITIGANPGEVLLTGVTGPAAFILRQVLAVPAVSGGPLHALAEIKNSGTSANGLYFVSFLDSSASPPSVNLASLNGNVASITLSGSPTITFYTGVIEGNSSNGVRVRRTVSEWAVDAHEHVYGVGWIRKGFNVDSELKFQESISGASWKLGDAGRVIQSGTASLTFTPNVLGTVVSGLTGMVTGPLGSTGHLLSLAGATGPLSVLNGNWRILAVLSATSVRIENTGAPAGAQTLFWQEAVDDAARTSNILAVDDFRLLNGVETGTPKDASLSHHHGSMYTRRVKVPVPNGGLLDLTFLTSAQELMLNNSGVLSTPQLVTTAHLPVGYSIVAFEVDVVVTVYVDAMASSGTAWNLSLETSPGTALDPLDNHVIWATGGVRSINPLADQYTFVSHAVIYVTPTVEAYFSFSGTSGVLSAATKVRFRPTALVCVRT